MGTMASQITVSNHRIHYLFNCWFRRRSKKTSKLRVTGLCAGNSPLTGEFLHNRSVMRKIFFYLVTSSSLTFCHTETPKPVCLAILLPTCLSGCSMFGLVWLLEPCVICVVRNVKYFATLPIIDYFIFHQGLFKADSTDSTWRGNETNLGKNLDLHAPRQTNIRHAVIWESSSQFKRTWKASFEIPHKISCPYIEKCTFHLSVTI